MSSTEVKDGVDKVSHPPIIVTANSFQVFLVPADFIGDIDMYKALWISILEDMACFFSRLMTEIMNFGKLCDADSF
jgi:hypothetical protein